VLLSHASLNTTTFDTRAERTRSIEKVKAPRRRFLILPSDAPEP
jgi:hypothetical protein